MLNFGLKRIIKKLMFANVVWVCVILFIEIFRLNTYNNLLEGNIHMPDFWVMYCIPTLILIGYDCFYERIVRLEVKEDALLITGLKFFFVHNLQIQQENITYKITSKKGLSSKHMRCLRIYDTGIEKYMIKEYDLNEELMNQTISFFRLQVKISANRTE